ncbi:MAG TPA: HD domain-containing protein [Acidobacteriaceae bacterium]|nr:HD domain-containing protein [Acidobacteriaceae bacterium]
MACGSKTEDCLDTNEDFRRPLAEYVRTQARPVDKLGHQPRLYRLTRLIGRACDYDDDVVYAAAWLHDLGVFIGHRPEDPAALAGWDNVGYAIEQAPAILRRVGFPAEKIPAVLEAIRTHQPQATPETWEGIVLRDADILEQLGAIAVLRIAAKIGRDTRYSTFTDAASSLRKALEDLPGKIRLDIARDLAKPRVELLREFLRELDDEAQADLG